MFPSLFLLAGENSMRTYFFYWREKILCVGFLSFLSFVKKKGFENTLFQTRGSGKKTRRSVLTYLYIIYYIKRTERRKHPKGITIHTVSF
jgi:hypothetical protein